MKLNRKQVEDLLFRMNEEEIWEIEIRETSNGKVNFFVPVVKLEQFRLNPRKSRKDLSQ